MQCVLLSRVPWSFGLPLVVIVSITVMILITSVIGVVYCRAVARRTQSGKQFPWIYDHKATVSEENIVHIKQNQILRFFADKYGETPRESLKQEALVSAKQGTCSVYDSSSLVFKSMLNVCASDFLCDSVSWQSLSPPGNQWHSLHNSGLQSSPEADRGVCKPEDAQNTSGSSGLHLWRRAWWDGGVLHAGNPPVNSEESLGSGTDFNCYYTVFLRGTQSLY